MKRTIIQIDEEKCVGCGLCVGACHEGAIGMVAGKAKLLRDDYCDGLGNCLPVCPTGAITFEEREAAAFDKEAVKLAQKVAQPEKFPCGCASTHAKEITRQSTITPPALTAAVQESSLRQWPVQIKLVPINAPYFKDANLLISADCAAYAYADFHRDFMQNKITLIGCPKLDEGDYSEKLTAILRENEIKSVTVVRMEVPCCGGIENATKAALQACGKMIPWQIITFSTDGKVLERL